MSRAILIAHYDKPLGWTDEIRKIKDLQVHIYTSNPEFKQYYQVRNRGNDASHYLSFIINNYESLPDQTVFCHHHNKDWTQELTLVEIIHRLNWDAAKYFSIGARCNYWTAIPFESKPYHIAAMKRSWTILEDYLPYPETLTYIAGTQFCVHKDLILQYPKEFYEKCRQWVYSVNEAEWFIGRFFEYTWHYIFTRNPIETEIPYLHE